MSVFLECVYIHGLKDESAAAAASTTADYCSYLMFSCTFGSTATIAFSSFSRTTGLCLE